MSKAHMKLGAALVTLAAAFGAVGASANAATAAASPETVRMSEEWTEGHCAEALTLYLIYRDYGDYATADRILGHLLVEGCVSYH
jgi:ABC-type proline/glycine betaine transport system substrate-binding protein